MFETVKPVSNNTSARSFCNAKKGRGSLFFQPKLTVGPVDDFCEREADAVADKVVNMSGRETINRKVSPVSVQRKCTHCAEEDEVQRKGDKEDNDDNINSGSLDSVHEVLSSSDGSPLDKNTKAFMENSFGRDFSSVRIHTGSVAAKSATSINALAYTTGNNIVFNDGQYSPSTKGGQRLLAHELTHVVQQGHSNSNRIQRTTYFGPAANPPSDWSTRVAAATTSAEKAALVQSALGSAVTVVDRTTESAGDTSPTAAHLEAFTSADPKINYDENLQSKRSPVDRRSLNVNAGYTLHSGGNSYIVLSPAAIESDDPYSIVVTVNHEFDHIRQHASGSTLQGNESELDAWTSTFIREFHRTYVLGDTGSTCYVHKISLFAPLLMYFTRTDVSDAQRTAAVDRIKAYYNGTLQPHAAHDKVFRFWIHRTLKNSSSPALAERLNTELNLSIDATAGLATTRRFPCTGVTGATFPSPPSVDLPTSTSSSAPAQTPPPSPRTAGLHGVSFQLPVSLVNFQLPLAGSTNVFMTPPVGARSTAWDSAYQPNIAAGINLSFHREGENGFELGLFGQGGLNVSANPPGPLTSEGSPSLFTGGNAQGYLQVSYVFFNLLPRQTSGAAGEDSPVMQGSVFVQPSAGRTWSNIPGAEGNSFGAQGGLQWQWNPHDNFQIVGALSLGYNGFIPDGASLEHSLVAGLSIGFQPVFDLWRRR